MRVTLALLLALAACTPAPQVPGAPTRGERLAAPALAPLGDVLAQAEGQAALSDPALSLDARVAGLRARAQALRGPVIPPALRARMRRAALQ